ncbi:hypothetical protein GRX03_13055 [Halovenus sp. WSH3]|uniref:SHOCT domain-containing protein n=1 Tax=Halovenus carboxidivorans TaxID=2692199 RepID=A0A6B0TAV4_9EURY|nr:hypothetical protein [Halovenus carboxidivorans]MXR52532.1 hypothetical protein [Halovenus carboxidivorans]
MADIDDLVEAVVDVEDVIEEVGDPEELVGDLIEDPFVIVFGLVAGFAGLLTMLLFAVTVGAILLSVGPLWILVSLTVFMFLVLLLAFGAFLYVRTSLSDSVQQKFDEALARADTNSNSTGSMTEQEAIDELKRLYAEGDLRDHELDQALDDVLTSDDPQRVLERYRDTDSAEYEYS